MHSPHRVMVSLKNDYYRQASALPYLRHIQRPTLIITAKDDPFLGVTAEPTDVSSDVLLLDTRYGGHIGFVDYDYQKDSLIWGLYHALHLIFWFL